MPQNLNVTRKQFRERIEERVKGMPKEEAVMVRAMAWGAYDQYREQQIQQRIDQQRAFEQRAAERGPVSGFVANRVGDVTAALTGVAAGPATLSRAPEMVNAAVGAELPEMGANVETYIEATARENPIAFGAGTVAGYFLPTFGKRTAEAGGAAAAKAVPQAGRFVERSLEASGGRKFLSQFLQNALTGSGAVAAQELTRGRDDAGSIHSRLMDTFENISPATSEGISGAGIVEQGLNLGAAALTSRFSGRVSPHLYPAIRRFEARTGQRVPFDVLTDRGSLTRSDVQRWFDAASKRPGGARAAQEVNESMFKALVKNLDDIAADVGINRNASPRRAARAVRRLAGEGSTDSLVRQTRQGIEGQAFSAARTRDTLSEDGQRVLLGHINDIITNLTSDKALSDAPKTMKVVRRLQKILESGEPITLGQLESIRLRLGDLGDFSRMPGVSVTSKDAHNLGRLYMAVREAITSSSPQYDEALRIGRELRRIEEALPALKNPDLVDTDVMTKFWRSPDRITRWKAVQRTLPLEDQQAIRGWYLGAFLDAAVSNSEKGTITAAALRRTMKQSMFDRETLETVLGKDVVGEVFDHMRISESFFKGTGRAEGSDTASRAGYGAEAILGMAGIPTAVYGLLTNNWTVVLGSLGPAGVATLVKYADASMVSGSLQTYMQNLARQGGPRGLSRIPAAASAVMDDQGNFTSRGGDRFNSEISAR